MQICSCHRFTRRVLCALTYFVMLSLPTLWAMPASAQPVIDHNIRASIDVKSQRLHISDRVRIPSTDQTWTFFLNATLDVSVSDPDTKATLTLLDEGDGELRLWELDAPPGTYVTLSIIGSPALPGTDPARGHISDLGVYLPPEAGWLPLFTNSRMTFAMAATLPDGWTLVTQGDSIKDPQGNAWREYKPQQGAWLVAGPFDKFEVKGSSPRLVAWLREPNEALARRYLEAASGWIGAYADAIGPYPYGKFALVENFWETGYAMPSFSLMGPRVLRLPFIVHTAWPHEVLHNWFGNGVFVRGGNWSEGLTAYLADHLVREGSGSGRAFRRDALQKYRNFVDAGTEFPVIEFRARHNPATAAIGYDKVMMIFHMLRQRLGDDTFRTALSNLFSQWRYRAASWADLENVFSETSGQDLASFFEQWTTRRGAPELALDKVRVIDECVSGTIRQSQSDDPWTVSVPVYVSYASGGDSKREVLTLTERETPFSICDARSAVRVDVDPWFDVLRRLSVRETPASIGELLGDENLLAILPTDADDAERGKWKSIADALKLETADDTAFDTLPVDRTVWLFGRSNRHLGPVLGSSATESGGRFGLAENDVGLDTHAVFVARRYGDAVVGVASVPSAGDPEAFVGRLQHYTRYSYLAFGPGERRAGVRGQWPVSGSPLTHLIDPDTDVNLTIKARAPLILPTQN